jgi:hypothetical protein
MGATLKTIDTKIVNSALNRCYLDYDPAWPAGIPDRVPGFKHHIEQTAGMKLDFTPAVKGGRLGYELTQVEVIDEQAFLMWMLKWQ